MSNITNTINEEILKNKQTMQNNKLYTISEVAEKLNLSTKTLRRWEADGKFSASRTIGGQRRYSLEDLQILDAIKHGTIPSKSDLLTLQQTANLFGVSEQTIIRWENEGKIHPFITAGNTYYPKTKLVEKMEALKNSNAQQQRAKELEAQKQIQQEIEEYTINTTTNTITQSNTPYMPTPTSIPTPNQPSPQPQPQPQPQHQPQSSLHHPSNRQHLNPQPSTPSADHQHNDIPNLLSTNKHTAPSTSPTPRSLQQHMIRIQQQLNETEPTPHQPQPQPTTPKQSKPTPPTLTTTSPTTLTKSSSSPKPKLKPLPLNKHTNHTTTTPSTMATILSATALNIIITLLMLFTYHTVTKPKVISPIVDKPQQQTQQGDVKGISRSLEDTLASILSPKGEINTPASINTTSNLSIGTFLSLLPSTKPQKPTPGTIYYDAETQTINVFTKNKWYRFPQPQTNNVSQDTQIISDTAVIQKNKTSVTVQNDKITKDTPISVTFHTNYSPAKKYWISQKDGSFTVYLDFPPTKNIKLTYFIITTPKDSTNEATPSASPNTP